MTKNFASLTGASVLAFGLGLAALPGAAHAGFLEQLFGVAPAPQAAAPSPSYRYDEPTFFQDAPVHHHAKRKVVIDEKPKLQRPTDLMHDVTLQNGDAVMTKGGLKVFTGDDGNSVHSKADFASLNEVDGMPKQEHKALVAMDTTRNDPLRGALSPDTISTGRSAAVASPIVSGHEIVDAAGKKVRYVGP